MSAEATVALRLVIDQAIVREAYDEYVQDVAYYRAADELIPDHPDVGYRTGTPPDFDAYLAEWTDGVVDDALAHGHSWRVERA